MKLLVTGGLGFIGSHFIRWSLARHPGCRIVNLDKKTYAGNPANLEDVSRNPRYRWVRGDIGDGTLASELMEGTDAVVHFAAESHVDRSIADPVAFLRTNVIGTQVLLSAARAQGVRRFLHVGTDEVYGSKAAGSSVETDALLPNSPYAASKAAADHLARAAFVTYGLPGIVTRSCNNFGPNQFPEKAIPLLITNALEDKPFPLYGDGKQVRDWLYVLDSVEALDAVLHRAKPGGVYNIGGAFSCPNRHLVYEILKLMGKPRSLIERVPDRLGHDRRYSVNCSKLQSEIGWRPRTAFSKALLETIEWYRNNRRWWQGIKGKSGFTRYYTRQYKTLARN